MGDEKEWSIELDDSILLDISDNYFDYASAHTNISIGDITLDDNWSSYTDWVINNDNQYQQRDNVTLTGGGEEMLRVAPDGFYVRGVKVEADDKEAEQVYKAFKQWLTWANLSKNPDE